MNRPVRANGGNKGGGANARGGNKGGRGGQPRGNGGGNGGSGEGRGAGAAGEARGPRRERPARKPFFAGDGAEAPRSQAPRSQAPRPAAANVAPDNDLSSTSDFRPVKKQFGNPGAKPGGRGGKPSGGNRDHASHGAHEAGSQRKAHQGNAAAASGEAKANRHTPAAAPKGDGRGPVRFGNDNRGQAPIDQRAAGHQGRKRTTRA
jgi:ATP-dependent RNA helicase RhlE